MPRDDAFSGAVPTSTADSSLQARVLARLAAQQGRAEGGASASSAPKRSADAVAGRAAASQAAALSVAGLELDSDSGEDESRSAGSFHAEVASSGDEDESRASHESCSDESEEEENEEGDGEEKADDDEDDEVSSSSSGSREYHGSKSVRINIGPEPPSPPSPPRVPRSLQDRVLARLAAADEGVTRPLPGRGAAPPPQQQQPVRSSAASKALQRGGRSEPPPGFGHASQPPGGRLFCSKRALVRCLRKRRWTVKALLIAIFTMQMSVIGSALYNMTGVNEPAPVELYNSRKEEKAALKGLPREAWLAAGIGTPPPGDVIATDYGGTP